MTRLPAQHYRDDRQEVFIDGAWVHSDSTDVIEVRDSATDEVFGSVPAGTPADIDAAVLAARTAFPSWSRTPVAERAALLRKAADGLEARADELTQTITRETGMPLAACRQVQVGGAIHFVRSAADVAAAYDFEERIGTSLVLREPAGVVAAISPWNYPLNQLIKKVAFALAAGCTVVAKPSEVAPLDAYVLAEVLDEVGLPRGVFNLVPGHGASVGQALSTHPGIDLVSLTGSTASGTKVMTAAAGTIKRVALELGGKSANILLDDLTDEAFDHAVQQGVERCLLNSGQTCAAQTRMLVPAARLGRAEEVARRTVSALTLGDPFDPATDLGPLASATHRDRVRDMIGQAIDEGVELLVGGTTVPAHLDRGYYVAPTVFTNVDNRSTIAQQEVFGPVLCLIPFTDTQDAIDIANDSDYGLSGGVWSSDPRHAVEVAREIRTGAVYINGSAPNLDAPFGGYKRSGIGREYGRVGMEEFLEYKSLHGAP